MPRNIRPLLDKILQQSLKSRLLPINLFSLTTLSCSALARDCKVFGSNPSSAQFEHVLSLEGHIYLLVSFYLVTGPDLPQGHICELSFWQ